MSILKDEVNLSEVELGAAMAATGVEGGDRNNDWFYWFTMGKIEDGSNPYVASEFYQRYERDAELAHSLGLKKMRLGVEWARIEPKKGVFDDGAIEHYKKIFKCFKDLNIDVLLDLHHFSNPVWFDSEGGFESVNCAQYFLEYAEVAAKAFLELVEGFVTFNEPNRLVHNAYVTGRWPMGVVGSAKRARKAMGNIAFIHIKAYALIHAMAKTLGIETKVGAFVSYRIFKSKYSMDIISNFRTHNKEARYQQSVDEAMFTAKFCRPLKKPKKFVLSERFEKLSILRLCADFAGISYYTRIVTNGGREEVKEGADTDDLGAEVYPEGLTKAVQNLKKYLIPVYVTSGVADKDDKFRSRFIAQQLEVLSRCIPIPARFYYDSLTDSFVWAHGIAARYGLIEVDFASQERRVRDSALFYKKIIENRKAVVDDELLQLTYNKNSDIAE